MSRSLRIVVWSMIKVPALAALAWVCWMGTVGPEVNYWRSARMESLGMFEWHQFADPGEFPAYLLDRAVLLGLLDIPGVDFQSVRFAPFALAVLCCVVFYRLLIGHGGSRNLRLGGMLVFVFWTFNPAFGANWLTAERMRTFMPPLFFLLSIWLLRTGDRWWWRVGTSAVLAQLALFSDKSGLFVWIALAPMIVTEARRRNGPRPWFHFAWWVVIGNVGTALCYSVLRAPGGQPGWFAFLADRPVDTLLDLAWAVGACVPRIDPVPYPEFAACGLLLSTFVILFVVLVWQRGNRARLHQAMPWLAFCIYGFGLTLVLVDLGIVDRNGEGLRSLEWLREHAWPGSFLCVGITGMLSIYARPVARLALPVAIGAALVLTAQDWHRGWEHLKMVRNILRTTEAELAFLGVAAAEMPLPPQTAHATIRFETSTVGAKIAARMRARGLLTGIPKVGSLSIRDFDVQPLPAEPVGGFLDLSPTRVQGAVRAKPFAPAPSMVMLTRQLDAGEERIFMLVKAYFYVPGKLFPFERPFTVEEPFREGEIVRAYGFELDGHRAIPFVGTRRFHGDAFEPVTEDN